MKRQLSVASPALRSPACYSAKHESLRRAKQSCQLPVGRPKVAAFILLPSSFCLLFLLAGCNGRVKPPGNGEVVVVDNRGKPVKPPAGRADLLKLRRPPAEEDLPQLSPDDARALFRVIRSDALRKLSGNLTRESLREFSELEIPQSLLAQNKAFVIVSLYPPAGGEPLSAFAAVGTLAFSAASAAYAALDQADPALLKTAKIKLDMVSAATPCGPEARLVPGVEGLVVVNKGLSFLPPDQFLGDSPTMKDYLRRLVRRAGMPEGSEDKPAALMLAKFSAAGILQLSDGAEPVFLYRGNALLEPPSAPAARKAAELGLDWLTRAAPDRAWLPYADRLAEEKLGATGQASVALALLRAPPAGPADARGPSERDRNVIRAGEQALDAVAALAVEDPRYKFTFVTDGEGLGAVGASAMTLLALCAHEGSRGAASANLGQLKALAAFLLQQQTPEGEFLSHFDPERGRAVKKFAEVNFPGQAILALLRLHELDGRKDPRLLEAARKGARRLAAEQRRDVEEKLKKGAKGAGLCIPDAWLMQALDALLEVGPDDDLATHLLALADLAAANQLTLADPAADAKLPPGKTRSPDLVGGMDEADPPGVAMTAARAEGLLAALRTARRLGQAEAAERIGQALELAAAYVLQNQYRPENAYGLARPERASGGFRASPLAGQIHPDGTAHGVLFLLEYAEAKARK